MQCPREDIPDFINGRGGVSEDSSPKKAVLPPSTLYDARAAAAVGVYVLYVYSQGAEKEL